MSCLLAIDLGGTTSRFGLVDLNDASEVFLHQAVYENKQFGGIEEVVTRYFAEHRLRADYLCLAVAGVVENGIVEMTNLSWRADGERLRERFGVNRVWLINDMLALAEAIPALQPADLFTICAGSASRGETIGIIAPGTGLGQGYLVFHEGDYIARGSEGGHSSFAPANNDELDLARWLLHQGSELSIEQICSGPGLSLLYTYYSTKKEVLPTEWVRQQVASAVDLAPIIVAGATSAEPCPLCGQVVDCFLRLLGRESGNLALKVYARGGIYIGGGVLLHLLGKVSFQPFIEAFHAKRKMRSLLERIPVYLITRKHVNLLGAVIYAKKRIG